MISRGRKRKGYWSRNRRRKSAGNLPGIALVVLAGFLVLWSGKTLWGALSSGGNIQSSTLMNIVQGTTEFSFADTDTWTIGASETKFIEGDSIRTNNNSEAYLTIFDRSLLFLGENTEIIVEELSQKKNGEKMAVITLNKGEIWTKVEEGDFNDESKSSFVINTPSSSVNVRGTVFDVKVTDVQEVIQLIKGNVDVDVYTDSERKESNNVSVGIGQKLVLNAESKEKILQSQDVLTSIDPSFSESEWHLSHLEQFFPEEANVIRRRIELKNPPVVETTPETDTETELDNSPIDEGIEKPTITAPVDGAVIPANVSNIQVEGTAPSDAEFITVNGYTLTKYIPGDRKWSYFASTKFGTIVPGENTYNVYATTRDGRKSGTSSIKITYEGQPVAAPTETTTETGTTSSNPSFTAPIITRPANGGFNDAYQTSSRVVTITGIVDPKTQSVEVNGFKLRKFVPGKTEFSYIANANYDNLKPGENTYNIIATGPDGETASVAVKIIYTPLDLGQ